MDPLNKLRIESKRLGKSLAQLVGLLPEKSRLSLLRKLRTDTLQYLPTNWQFWARPNQLEPERDYLYWLVLAGRGYGKTRTGGETVRGWAETGKYQNIGLIAPTEGDARDIMINGPSGIMATADPRFRPEYIQKHRQLTWPNGVRAVHFSAEKADRLRGPNLDAAWCDELASWGTGEKQEQSMKYTWDMLMFTLRGGDAPRVVITTTPRPLKLIKELRRNAGTILTTGSTYENRANVAPKWLEKILSDYEGTRLGRQELHAEILEDVPGALWTNAMFWDHRATPQDLLRVVVAIDPATTSTGDEHGIVVAARSANGHGYVLADRSMRGSPMDAIRRAIHVYKEFQADCLVYESNQGGEMILALIATVDENTRVKAVHASRNKITRAEPIAALYEQGRIHHADRFELLEDQCLSYAPGMPSPDRMDALVWALTELFLEPQPMLIQYQDFRQISRY